ncbi:CysZ protein [Cohaesibacter sp. ES.047]|uniref:sulfate transporter family protein n=1 Tax=Cohaesibacter sp. ES.047 TaxID=1798205 RepID=UPI000BB8F840|nr:sulfate transporter family protein [Cohaesibacter sp. ES.047]SNY90497.1 CysZ protein [Cohaesibacter sp. ES.047]
MLSSAILAFNQLFTKPFRSVLWKMLGITMLLLVLVWIGMESGIGYLLSQEDFLPGWAETTAKIVTGLGFVFGLWFLIIPVSTVVAGLFLDEVSHVVETTHYPHEPHGKDMSIPDTVVQTARFLGVVILVNLVVLLLIPFLGLGVILFFIANGYLLGREYFEQAALRYHTRAELKELRSRHGAKIFFCGLLIACFIAVPVLNLLTPLFATAFMVHVRKRLTGSTPVNTD